MAQVTLGRSLTPVLSTTYEGVRVSGAVRCREPSKSIRKKTNSTPERDPTKKIRSSLTRRRRNRTRADRGMRERVYETRGGARCRSGAVRKLRDVVQDLHDL